MLKPTQIFPFIFIILGNSVSVCNFCKINEHKNEFGRKITEIRTIKIALVNNWTDYLNEPFCVAPYK